MNEPFLHNIPVEELKPVYWDMGTRAFLPIGLAAFLVTCCIAAPALGAEGAAGWPLRFGWRLACVFGAIAVVTRETFYQPTRRSTQELAAKDWLPSTLSEFAHVETGVSDHAAPARPTRSLGVHYLRYDADDHCGAHTPFCAHDNPMVDVIYFNHGFGASCLSWLPSLPSLVCGLGARVGLGHDATGFGFTERPKPRWPGCHDLALYSSDASADIGTHLLLQGAQCTEAGEDDGAAPPSRLGSVVLFGHSMGSPVSLKMALKLPASVRVHVILVDPCLIGTLPSTPGEQGFLPAALRKALDYGASGLRAMLSVLQPVTSRVGRCLAFLRHVVLDVPVSCLLNAVVSNNLFDFWTFALTLIAWARGNELSKTDALRYQWPALAEDWEAGVLAFVRSRLLFKNYYPGGEYKLLQDVAQLPNTSVSIIHGRQDSLIPLRWSKEASANFPQVRLVEAEGQGHNPHEEAVGEFVQTVVSIVRDDLEQRSVSRIPEVEGQGDSPHEEAVSELVENVAEPPPRPSGASP